MPQPRVFQIISELPFERKLIALGAVLLSLSLFFTWYSDQDIFKSGQTFSGLEGPLYLMGFSLLLISVLSLVFVGMDYFHRKVTFFHIKSSRMYFGFGVLSFYLLFLENSIYFDHNFGMNLSSKAPGFGMFMAFIAAAFLTAGGHLALREKKALLEDFVEETREPVMSSPMMNSKPSMPRPVQQKPRESIRTVYPHPASPVSDASTHKMQLSDAEKQKIRENLRRSAYVGSSSSRDIPISASHSKPLQAPSSQPSETSSTSRPLDQAVKNPQPFRMDL